MNKMDTVNCLLKFTKKNKTTLIFQTRKLWEERLGAGGADISGSEKGGFDLKTENHSGICLCYYNSCHAERWMAKLTETLLPLYNGTFSISKL